MECNKPGNGRKLMGRGSAEAARARGFKRKHVAADSRHMRLDDAAELPRQPLHHQALESHIPQGTVHNTQLQAENPFMKNMAEIFFWIRTKKAPCLYSYENLIKYKSEQADCSQPIASSSHSASIKEPSPKKKRKNKILDESSVSTEKPHNVYFDVPQRDKLVLKSCRSDSGSQSDVDFNIKNSPIQKRRKNKLQKGSKTALHRKNKIVTSTPKVTSQCLRRSLRKAQNGFNTSGVQFNVYSTMDISGRRHIRDEQPNCLEKQKHSLRIGNGHESKCNVEPIESADQVETGLNGQFDDMSDVSGLTANYIRSTKLNSSKVSKHLRSKGSRNLLKDSLTKLDIVDKPIVVCVNKCVNTTAEVPDPLNVSSSSLNVVNLITTTNSKDKNIKVNKSTSLLKFINTKITKNRNTKKVESKQRMDVELNETNALTPGTSRYPKRNNSLALNLRHVQTNNQSPTKAKSKKCMSDPNDSDWKENPNEQGVSRTRSGRSIGLALMQPDNSLHMYSNSTEKLSSGATVNVASPDHNHTPRRRSNKRTPPLNHSNQTNKRGRRCKKDSRDKSGFTACFSESEEDGDRPKLRKFFY